MTLKKKSDTLTIKIALENNGGEGGNIQRSSGDSGI